MYTEGAYWTAPFTSYFAAARYRPIARITRQLISKYFFFMKSRPKGRVYKSVGVSLSMDCVSGYFNTKAKPDPLWNHLGKNAHISPVYVLPQIGSGKAIQDIFPDHGQTRSTSKSFGYECTHLPRVFFTANWIQQSHSRYFSRPWPNPIHFEIIWVWMHTSPPCIFYCKSDQSMPFNIFFQTMAKPDPLRIIWVRMYTSPPCIFYRESDQAMPFKIFFSRLHVDFAKEVSNIHASDRLLRTKKLFEMRMESSQQAVQWFLGVFTSFFFSTFHQLRPETPRPFFSSKHFTVHRTRRLFEPTHGKPNGFCAHLVICESPFPNVNHRRMDLISAEGW